MNMPPMDPSNVLARVNDRLNTLDRMVRELAAASGTLDAATIYKRGLTVLSESNNSKMYLSNGSIWMWDDYVDNPPTPGRIYTDPVAGANYMRWFPPYSDGNGSQNSVTLRGAAPGVVGAFWVYTDGVLSLRAGGRVYIEGAGVDVLSGGSLKIFELPTTGSAANLRLDPGTAAIQYVTSSQRYKEDVAPAVVDVDDVLQLQPKTWVDKGTIDRSEPGDIVRNVGFIAEDLDALPSMRQFVDYDAEGRPDAIQYDRLTAATLVLAQRQSAQLADQQAQIDALSARLDALEGATA